MTSVLVLLLAVAEAGLNKLPAVQGVPEPKAELLPQGCPLSEACSDASPSVLS